MWLQGEESGKERNGIVHSVPGFSNHPSEDYTQKFFTAKKFCCTISLILVCSFISLHFGHWAKHGLIQMCAEMTRSLFQSINLFVFPHDFYITREFLSFLFRVDG